ncbi:Oidioi.mRNA.OKI2018_I69.chr2.g4796.t1.cds [Oikopleura dioica]|uniref:Oidioi.mRNA.OKI2018_I69.chr2.g4796.t1.cds n=1 Tax=Oikopleura dioica TaxID=34765 RepID=A0ABN7T438_OIKDI|nr:Oidioi.mRNA.OKI2018_I69.chr2.g4796.t1.cds [Oikopleura dioica]
MAEQIDVDDEVFRPRTSSSPGEVMKKHPNPFSKKNARRNTRTASDLLAEMNSRRTSQAVENVGIVMPLDQCQQNDKNHQRNHNHQHLKYDLETEFLNKLFGDIKSADYIFLVVGVLVTILVIASDTLFCLNADRIYQEKLLPWQISLSSILVCTLISLLAGWCQLRKNSTIFLLITAEIALLGFLLGGGLTYVHILRISKSWYLVELGMILSLSLSSLSFLLLSYVVYQVQYVIRRLMYDTEMHAFEQSRQISMIDKLIVNVDMATTATVLLPSEKPSTP